MGPGLAAGGRECGVGGRAACVPRPPDSLGRQPALPAGLIGVRRPPRRGMGGGGGAGGGRGGVPRPPSWSRPAPGEAAVPRRLRPLLYRQPPTVAWGPRHCPGSACPLLSPGGWGGGGGVRRPPRRPHPVGGGAAVPRRLCPLLYRQPPTAAWGPSPLPGPHPSPKQDPGPSPRAGAPSWAVGV